MLLDCREVSSGYAGSIICSNVNLQVANGEAVCVLGRNGAGKTTLLRTIVGYLTPVAGRIFFRGDDITGLRVHQICRNGISFAPEGRGIFRDLTVAENLKLFSRRATGPVTCRRLFELVPILRSRAELPAGRLSGGEQQILSIANSLLLNPSLLIIDELSEGLQPLIIDIIVDLLAEVRLSTGLAVLFVEQSIDLALDISDRAYILEKGIIALSERSELLRLDHSRLREYISI